MTPRHVADLSTCNRGDRVRLADGRLVELGFPMWWHGTRREDQAKTPPAGWFAREIVDDWGTELRVDLPRMLDLATPAVAVERDGLPRANPMLDGDGRHGDELDPLAAGSSRKRSNPDQGGLW